MKYVVDMIDSIPNSNLNFIVSPGCDMPYDTPIENSIAVSQAVLELEITRKIIENYQITFTVFKEWEKLPFTLKKDIVELYIAIDRAEKILKKFTYPLKEYLYLQKAYTIDEIYNILIIIKLIEII